MRDNYDADATPPPEETEPDAAGEVFQRRRFAVGSRTTIMLGLALTATALGALAAQGTPFTITYF
ncbi:MAG TPA: hypothetical protein VH333_22670 [Pseudonocardiaceae bacterium]|jgi:hypothetical protein|nr:hypothetical protein [Pseudonocardiaceae bacterium]